KCEDYAVTAKVFALRAPPSSDTRYWLEQAAVAADLLRGPILEDESAALQTIAHSGKWFTRKTTNGVYMEFPTALEHIHISATVVDYDGFSILTLEQD